MCCCKCRKDFRTIFFVFALTEMFFIRFAVLKSIKRCVRVLAASALRKDFVLISFKCIYFQYKAIELYLTLLQTQFRERTFFQSRSLPLFCLIENGLCFLSIFFFCLCALVCISSKTLILLCVAPIELWNCAMSENYTNTNKNFKTNAGFSTSTHTHNAEIPPNERK